MTTIGVASARRLPSDTGAFAGWVAADRGDDLCLGFCACAAEGGAAASSAAAGGVAWAASNSSQPANYVSPATDIGTVVLASTFHHHEQSLLPPPATEQQHQASPLLGPTPCATSDCIQLWLPVQPQPPNPNPTFSDYLGKPDPASLDAGGILAAGAPTCVDCRNQAKMDPSHRQCGTCCKKRGLEWSTHIRSTWLPGSRLHEHLFSASTPKKPRPAVPRIERATVPRSFDANFTHQDTTVRDSLPRHVRAPGMFKCVRMSSVDDGGHEYAYLAMVKIGGRVFKGFLYGQGLDGSAKDAIPTISELRLGNQNGGSSSSLPSPALPPDLSNYSSQIR